MELIIFIIIAVVVSKAFKQSKELQERQRRNNPNPWDTLRNQQNSSQNYSSQRTSNQRTSSQRTSNQRTSSQNVQWKQAARENIEKAKRRAEEKMRRVENAFEAENTQKTAMQQVRAGRMEARNTTILQRAKANANEDKVDVTLQTMEAEHNHSERVAPAVHDHPEDIIPENLLGNIEDLMVKGYDGNLCFERDFVGEAMDMISRFTAPTDIPDFSKDDVA